MSDGGFGGKERGPQCVKCNRIVIEVKKGVCLDYRRGKVKHFKRNKGVQK